MSAREKALGVLRDGRLTVLAAVTNHGDTRPVVILAAVKSSRVGGPTYAVDRRGGEWTCTCNDPCCKHIDAVRLVTGHATADLLLKGTLR